jgi:hypothetical protein
MHPLRAAGERAQGVNAQETAANARRVESRREVLRSHCWTLRAGCCAPDAGGSLPVRHRFLTQKKRAASAHLCAGVAAFAADAERRRGNVHVR